MKYRIWGIGILFALWLSACAPADAATPAFTRVEQSPLQLPAVTQSPATPRPSSTPKAQTYELPVEDSRRAGATAASPS